MRLNRPLAHEVQFYVFMNDLVLKNAFLKGFSVYGINSCLLLCALIFLSTFKDLNAMSPKLKHIKSLQITKKENTSALQKIDYKLKTNESIDIVSSTDQLSTLFKNKDEHLLRQHFYDQLIFKFNTKYSSQSLKLFLVQQLNAMAYTEVKNNERNINYWQFLKHLSKAITTLPEKNENILDFLKGYVEVSSISNPITPKEYLKRKNYSNSIEVVTVKSVSKENVGELLEKKIDEIEAKAMMDKLEAIEPVSINFIEPVQTKITKQPVQSVIQSNELNKKTDSEFSLKIEPRKPRKSLSKSKVFEDKPTPIESVHSEIYNSNNIELKSEFRKDFNSTITTESLTYTEPSAYDKFKEAMKAQQKLKK